MTKAKFFWSQSTLLYFRGLLSYQYDENRNKIYKVDSKVNKLIDTYVRWDCQLEEAETYEELAEDLINQVYKYV